MSYITDIFISPFKLYEAISFNDPCKSLKVKLKQMIYKDQPQQKKYLFYPKNISMTL